MERPSGVGRGKRPLDHASSSRDHEAHQPDRKRPALASVIVEALKADSLQKLCSFLEPVLRRIVSEELERGLAKLGPSKFPVRSSPKRIEGRNGRNLQLLFKSKLSLPLFTGGKVEGEHGAAIHVVLMDASTGHAVASGRESSAKLDVVVLEGDFNKEDDESWTEEEFESYIVKERDGKRPLLTGDLQVTLKEGVGALGELTFTDNSSWIRSRKFRLGLKVASGCCEGIRIREARTDAFTVKDHRGELYKKHYPPAPNDEVWRLEKIGKDGQFHKRLSRARIYSVEDFLRLAVRDYQKLRNILGSGMSNKMWDVLLEHAKTCVPSGKHYVYYPEEMKDVSLVFNHICQFRGLISNGQYYSVDSLSDGQKLTVDGLVKAAYDNWMSVVEYDGQSPLHFKPNQSVVDVGNSFPMTRQEISLSYEHQMALPSFGVPNPVEQPATAATPLIAGYNFQSMRFPTQLQNGNLCTQMPFDTMGLPSQNPLVGNLQQLPFPRSDNLLSLGPPQPSTSGLQNIDMSNLASFGGADDFFPEEEIRMRSNEMLENEDMLHLLRMINMGSAGHVSYNVPDDRYQYSSNHIQSSYPNYGFGDEQSRSSGKAVVGWLKLKAALRWGIFVRKKAAERRAQLIELDDL